MQVTTVIPARSEGHKRLTKKSQLLVAKTLVDLTNDVIPLRLLNPTDQLQTVYQNTIATWCEPVEEVSETSQQGAAGCQATKSIFTNGTHHAWTNFRKQKLRHCQLNLLMCLPVLLMTWGEQALSYQHRGQEANQPEP